MLSFLQIQGVLYPFFSLIEDSKATTMTLLDCYLEIALILLDQLNMFFF